MINGGFKDEMDFPSMEMILQNINLAPLISFLSSFGILRWMLKRGVADIVVDHPNARSLHSVPTPRTGGVALVAGIFLGWVFMGYSMFFPFIFAAVSMLIVSLADDLWGGPASLRLLAHFTIVFIFLVLWAPIHIAWFCMLVTLIAMVWMTNLYNFMDGSDGLAAGMTCIGFSCYAAAAWLARDFGFCIAMLCITASALAFLVFNFYPARIFMGDSGSIPLGFLAAALGLQGWQHHGWPLWFPFLVLSPFIVDATATLFKRLLRKEPFWQAHRSHYYQRLIQLGWGHKKTALVEYALMVACGVSAVILLRQSWEWRCVVLVAWTVIYFAFMVAIDVAWRKHTDIAHGISSL